MVSLTKDNRDGLMISNMHTHEMLEVSNRRGEKKMKPNTSSEIIMKAFQVLIGLIRWYLIMAAWVRQHVGIKR